MRHLRIAPLAAIMAATLAASAIARAGSIPEPETRIDAGLQATVEKRLLGDRTGACFAVAVVEGRESGEGFDVRRSYACADGSDTPRIGRNSAFEIGSVSKTMAAALLAGLIESGQADLDDPLADYLPEGTAVPEHEGQPILLRHVVTHTSGLPRLPPGVPITDPADPYAAMSPEDLLQALGRSALSHAPGERFEYSNFASMLLSLAVARRAGMDFESLLADRLFAPLGMEGAYITDPPAGVVAARGHATDGQAAPAWHFATDLAGVGGVRATLDDMVRYVEAQLGNAPGSLDAALALIRQPLATGIAQPMAMNWLLVPLDGRDVHAHEGGTGGFASFVGLDVERRRGVVVLSDTEQFSLGGLGDIGMHLIDPRLPLGGPKRAPSTSSAPELDAYVGEYPLAPSFVVTVRARDGVLHAQATGQQEFALGRAGEDVFVIDAVGAELRFLRGGGDEVVALELHQAGHVTRGEKR
ncbi:serine hydrolase [Marilutibacter alkalisoli]|uniref:Beta-lactamase n=1 Tax=Marilutibacter alkalisoli TaxID=2591633 RepID=A0A514BQ62_9GAMM|nr:serine hydrolase [Lysobacter alkalisoli]QDH69544.1 serine hydrolase [Lysobacter alkalisoli]